MEVIEPIPVEGTYVPIRGNAFFSIKNMPLLVFRDWLWSARFVLYENFIETKANFVIRSNYTEIKSVDVARFLGTARLRIDFKDKLFSFNARVQGDDVLAAVLRFFSRKNIPLTESAQTFIKEEKMHREIVEEDKAERERQSC